MAETIKCACSKCGAKYRLPIEAQGRTARCKRCGEKFEVPRQQSLEDSVLAWLASPEDEDAEEAVEQPKVISMPAEAQATDQAADAAKKMRGPIRMKTPGKGETA